MQTLTHSVCVLPWTKFWDLRQLRSSGQLFIQRSTCSLSVLTLWRYTKCENTECNRTYTQQLRKTFIYEQLSFYFSFFFYLPIHVISPFDANNDIGDEVTRLLNEITIQGCLNISLFLFFLALFILLAHFRAKLHVGNTHNPGYSFA